MSSESKSSEPSESSTDPSESSNVDPFEGYGEASPGEIRVPIVDDHFEYTVEKMKDGLDELTGINGPSKGQYVTVWVEIANVSSERRHLHLSNASLILADGVKYSVDEDATGGMEGGEVWFHEFGLLPIRLGESIEGTLVYNIPKDAKTSFVHFSDYSGKDGVYFKFG